MLTSEVVTAILAFRGEREIVVGNGVGSTISDI